jgi:TolB-like protein
VTVALGLLARRAWLAGAGHDTSIAVLPLENLSGDPSQDYFADGVTEGVIAQLSPIRSLRVVSRTSVMHYQTVRKPLPEIAKELEVDCVLEGSVQRSGGQVRVTVQLIDGATDKHLWSTAALRTC